MKGRGQCLMSYGPFNLQTWLVTTRNNFRFDLTKLTPAGPTKMGLSLLGNGYTVLKIKDGLTGLEAWAVTQVSRILMRKYKS